MKIVMVLTSHGQLGNTGRKTGSWLEEFAAPYFVFRDAGVELTLASPKGGQPPIDPKSDLSGNQTPAMARFKQDAQAQKHLSQTVKLSGIRSQDFDTIFYVGGHGPMWDLVDNSDSIALIESFYNAGKPVATAQFTACAKKASGQALETFFATWLNKTGLPSGQTGGPFTVTTFYPDVERTLIVYGTKDEQAANREAAQDLRKALLGSFEPATVLGLIRELFGTRWRAAA